MADPYDKRASARRQALLALLSGTVAEPAAGIAGLYGLVTGGVNKGVHNVEATRDALTYHPRDTSALEAVGRAVEPVTGRLQKLRDYLGDKTMAHTGSPALATAGYMVPDTLLTLLGARGAGVKGPKLAQIAERSVADAGMGSRGAQAGSIGVKPAFSPTTSETWPDGTVIQFGESPFPPIPHRVELPSGRDLASAQEREINLADLHGAQTRITKNGLEKARDDSAGLPLVVESNGIKYIQDGHHRLSADLFAGKTTARVRFIKKG